jgi:hypothetical protein
VPARFNRTLLGCLAADEELLGDGPLPTPLERVPNGLG